MTKNEMEQHFLSDHRFHCRYLRAQLKILTKHNCQGRIYWIDANFLQLLNHYKSLCLICCSCFSWCSKSLWVSETYERWLITWENCLYLGNMYPAWTTVVAVVFVELMDCLFFFLMNCVKINIHVEKFELRLLQRHVLNESSCYSDQV